MNKVAVHSFIFRSAIWNLVGEGAYDHDFNCIGFEEIQMMRRILFTILYDIFIFIGLIFSYPLIYMIITYRGNILLFNPNDNHSCVQCDGGTLDYRGLNISKKTMLSLMEEMFEDTCTE